MKGRLLKYDEIGWWYTHHLCEDFPENEIKPLDDILKLSIDGRYDIFVYGDAEVVGYATIWKRQGCGTCLLDYLGVPSVLRNQGIGKRILHDVGQRITQPNVSDSQNEGEFCAGLTQPCLILESEVPVPDGDEEENLIRRRRLAFYERNDFIKIYEMGTCGMRFAAMSYKSIPQNMPQVMREHRAIYGQEREDVIVPLPAGEKPPMPYWLNG